MVLLHPTAKTTKVFRYSTIVLVDTAHPTPTPPARQLSSSEVSDISLGPDWPTAAAAKQRRVESIVEAVRTGKRPPSGQTRHRRTKYQRRHGKNRFPADETDSDSDKEATEATPGCMCSTFPILPRPVDQHYPTQAFSELARADLRPSNTAAQIERRRTDTYASAASQSHDEGV